MSWKPDEKPWGGSKTKRGQNFVSEYPNFQSDEWQKIQSFAQRMSWPPITDIPKLLFEIECLRTDQPNVPTRLRKFNPNLQIEHSSREEFQITLKHTCEEQEWDEIALVNITGMGRGDIALKNFSKGNVLLDYHGIEVPFEQYRAVHQSWYEQPESRMPQYCIEIVRGKRRLNDATLEPCSCHPGRSCFGRPCNHANENDPKCKLRMVEIQADKIYGGKERWRRVVFMEDVISSQRNN